VHGPGWRRKRAGRGFAYYDVDGSLIKDERLDRLRSLAIPPAWKDVWICPWPNGHIQATGVDAAGRRQYRYHDAWRAKRDAEKHERVLEIAHAAARRPGRRRRGHRRGGLTRERVLATAVRLLDLGTFRVGSEQYARTTARSGWPRCAASTSGCAVSGCSSPTPRRAASSASWSSPTSRPPTSSGSC
jgi:DNA topoisomerase IB